MIDLADYQELVVRQTKEMLEIFTGFETANRYRVLTPEGEEAMFAYEESGMLSRQFMGSHRPLNLHVIDNNGQPILNAYRNFFWLFSHLNVLDGSGAPIGSLHRKFGVFHRKFALLDSGGQQIAGLNGSLFRRYTFTLNNASGQEMGRIVKQWGGILREGFTDADTFSIQFSDLERSQEMRLLLLASAFAIDLDFFENKGSRSGIG